MVHVPTVYITYKPMLGAGAHSFKKADDLEAEAG